MSLENDVRDLCFDNAGLRAKLELAEAALEVERWGRYESPVSQDEGLRNIRANWDSMVRDNQALRAKLAEAEGKLNAAWDIGTRMSDPLVHELMLVLARKGGT